MSAQDDQSNNCVNTCSKSLLSLQYVQLYATDHPRFVSIFQLPKLLQNRFRKHVMTPVVFSRSPFKLLPRFYLQHFWEKGLPRKLSACSRMCLHFVGILACDWKLSDALLWVVDVILERN